MKHPRVKVYCRICNSWKYITNIGIVMHNRVYNLFGCSDCKTTYRTITGKVIEDYEILVKNHNIEYPTQEDKDNNKPKKNIGNYIDWRNQNL